MIESKDVLALCARFQEFLVPLDMHVLRQRDNGLIVTDLPPFFERTSPYNPLKSLRL
jgi:hypothetical protein